MAVATATRETRTRTASERLLAALPLVTIFACLSFFYAWQGWRLSAPWTFYDELYYTNLARSLSGPDSLNLDLGGAPAVWTKLYAVVISPAWLVDDTETAYAIVKYAGALLMTTVLFPTYALARTVASRGYALFAAAGAAAVPALSYSSEIMEEVLAYPFAALCFLLIVNALATRRWPWIAGAVAACALGPLVRRELLVLPAAFALAAGLYAATSPTGRARWSQARLPTRIAVVAAALGLALLAAWALTGVSEQWSTAFDRRGVALDHILRGAGALVVGMAFLPAVAALALLLTPSRLLSNDRLRALGCLFAASLVGFLVYSGAKAAYLSATDDVNPVQERNLIYLVPLFFVAAAVWLEARRVGLVALSAAAVIAGLVVFSIPLSFPGYPASDAPSFAIVTKLHGWGWSNGAIRATLVAAVAASLVVLAALPFLRRAGGTLGRVALASIGVAVLGWALVAGFFATDAAVAWTRDATRTLPRPLDWVDRATDGGRAVYVGQSVTRPMDLMYLGFWNPSVAGLFTLDEPPLPGIEQVPIREGRPPATDGDAQYVVAGYGITPAGRPILRRGAWTLYEAQPPVRLASAAVGVYGDGWMGENASYWQLTGGRPGTARVTASLQFLCGPVPPAVVQVRAVQLERRPGGALASGETTGRRTMRVPPCESRRVALPAEPPFRLRVRVSPTFVPATLNPGSADTRRLGVQPRFSFTPG